MRKFVCDRLTEAAQEILGVFEKRAQDYELELARLRRQLDSVYTPEIKLRRTELDLRPQIKDEQNDVIISEIQQPKASTSVQAGVHRNEVQGPDPERAQNVARKDQQQASTSHQETPEPSRPHTPEANGKHDHIIQNSSNNTMATQTKYSQSLNKCSHGYRLPKSHVSKQSNSSRNDKKPLLSNGSAKKIKSSGDNVSVQSGDIPLDENFDPPPMEIIEIIDISPASSDIEIIQDDNGPMTNQNQREMSDTSGEKSLNNSDNENSTLILSVESTPCKTRKHKSKSGEKSSPQCCSIPKSVVDQDDISDNTENATMTNVTVNTSSTSDMPSTSTNVPSELSELTAVEEYFTLLEEVIQNDEHISENSPGDTTNDKSLDGKTATESHNLSSQKKTASSVTESMLNKNYNTGKCTEPAQQHRKHNDEQRISNKSTEQTTINKLPIESTASTSSNGSSKRKNSEDATFYVSANQPILTQRSAEDIGVYTTNPETTQSEKLSNDHTAQNATAASSKKTGTNPFECDRCGKVLRNFKNYKFHMKSHTVEKSYKCETCGKMFRESWDLNKHLIIHTEEKPFKCKDCGRGFNRRFNLDLHMRIHTGEKPYACSSCEKAFTSRVNLKKHERIHTGEKPYTCDHCGKEFADSSSFRNHQRVHTGEKPYKCSWCKKMFATRTTLKRHLRIHTGEKPYKCTVCEKGFATNTDMKVHLRIHTGEKPYKCKNCGQNFSSWTNYNRHKNVHKQTVEPSSTD